MYIKYCALSLSIYIYIIHIIHIYNNSSDEHVEHVHPYVHTYTIGSSRQCGELVEVTIQGYCCCSFGRRGEGCFLTPFIIELVWRCRKFDLD